eukprot:553582-Rhodomonas_salina.1
MKGRSGRVGPSTNLFSSKRSRFCCDSRRTKSFSCSSPDCVRAIPLPGRDSTPAAGFAETGRVLGADGVDNTEDCRREKWPEGGRTTGAAFEKKTAEVRSTALRQYISHVLRWHTTCIAAGIRHWAVGAHPARVCE